MSDERLKLQLVDAVYGELDDRAQAQLREALARDPELDADLRALEATRRLYAEDVLPEPAPLLSEAILRQEPILRQTPEPWYSRLWQLAWHPAVGLTALVVVVASAGLLVKLATPPASDGVAAVATEEPAALPAVAPEPPSPAPPTTAAVDLEAATADKVDLAPADEQAPGARAKTGAAAPPAADALEQKARKDAPARPTADDDGALDARKAPSTWEASRRRAMNKAMGEALDEKRAPEADLGLKDKAEARRQEAQEESTSSDEAQRVLQPASATEREAPTYAQRASAQPPSALREPGRPAKGAAGQLTDPAILGRDLDDAAPRGSASNVGLLDSSAAGGLGSGAKATESAAPAAKKARPLPSRQVRAPAAQAQAELGQINKLQHARRAQEYLDAGQVAYDNRAFDEALGHFVRAQQLDRGNALAPMPQLGQARSLFKLKRYREAAALYQRVLDGYPDYPRRAQVARLLAACHDALGDTALAQRARRLASESEALLDEQAPAETAPAAASPAAKPAQARPAAD